MLQVGGSSGKAPGHKPDGEARTTNNRSSPRSVRSRRRFPCACADCTNGLSSGKSPAISSSLDAITVGSRRLPTFQPKQLRNRTVPSMQRRCGCWHQMHTTLLRSCMLRLARLTRGKPRLLGDHTAYATWVLMKGLLCVDECASETDRTLAPTIDIGTRTWSSRISAWQECDARPNNNMWADALPSNYIVAMCVGWCESLPCTSLESHQHVQFPGPSSVIGVSCAGAKTPNTQQSSLSDADQTWPRHECGGACAQPCPAKALLNYLGRSAIAVLGLTRLQSLPMSFCSANLAARCGACGGLCSTQHTRRRGVGPAVSTDAPIPKTYNAAHFLRNGEEQRCLGNTTQLYPEKRENCPEKRA